ncbi:MAG: hypothetical protein ABR597_14640 [Bacteroidales bacterium]
MDNIDQNRRNGNIKEYLFPVFRTFSGHPCKLQASGYEYIIGARLKNEPDKNKTEILQHTFSEGNTTSIIKNENTRLIVNYSKDRASKDSGRKAHQIEHQQPGL